MTDIYSPSQRALQDEFDTRRLADAHQMTIIADGIDDDRRAFIESRDFFFLSTVGADGWPTVSYKGGPTGVVQVEDERTIVFPSYDGNGMFLSMGNIAAGGGGATPRSGCCSSTSRRRTGCGSTRRPRSIATIRRSTASRERS